MLGSVLVPILMLCSTVKYDTFGRWAAASFRVSTSSNTLSNPPAKCASSIFCYDCNSEFDPRCGPDFDPFSLGTVNCSLRDQPDHIEPMEPTFCRTIKMDIFGKIRMVRTCGYLRDTVNLRENATCRRVSGTGDVFTTYCECDTDLCNAAGSRGATEMAVFAIIVTAILF